MKRPESMTAARRWSSSARRGAYCAFTSTRGMLTPVESTRTSGAPCSDGALGRTAARAPLPSPHDEVDDPRREERDEGVVGEMPGVLEALPAGPEREPRAGEPEAPRNRPEEGEDGVADERHLGDPGRDRDERAHDRENARDEHRRIAPPVEPRLRPVELLRRDVQPAPVALQIRATAVEADSPAEDRSE